MPKNRSHITVNQEAGKPEDGHHRTILRRIARQAMIERGLQPDFSSEVLRELANIQGPASRPVEPARDLQNLPWCSIDNDDSLDLDQLTVAEAMPGGTVKIRVAVADVDALARKDSAIDAHARQNTTSVYTAARIFPMLPDKLSTDFTSLKCGEDRPAIVIDMTVGPDGRLMGSEIYGAMVRNYAKLAYNSVAAWLEGGEGHMPVSVAEVKDLAENLRLQNRMAQILKKHRQEHGALDLETIEARPIFVEDIIEDLEIERRNQAKEIIEDFMIAANGVTARYLKVRGLPSLRRVVRSPKRWERIVEVAAQHGFQLPQGPDSRALALFLAGQRAADPVRFPDLSLTVIKLMGKGEYVVETPEEKTIGHFGLAVRDYTHSTAPNRRFPDLITQRLLKAALRGDRLPYEPEDLEKMARHCTAKEDDATKVERRVGKSAAALLLASKIGETFEGICTGAADKGTWVRIFHPPLEGRLLYGFAGVDVGHRIRVELIHTDVERGYIDFKRVDAGRS